MGSDSYTTVFCHTQQFMHYIVVQYNILKYKLLCMEKNCYVWILLDVRDRLHNLNNI